MKSVFIEKASFSKWLNSTKLKDVFEEWYDDTAVAEAEGFWTSSTGLETDYLLNFI